jgi:hypothetical protein
VFCQPPVAAGLPAGGRRRSARCKGTRLAEACRCGGVTLAMESSTLSPSSGASTTIYASPVSTSAPQNAQFMLRDRGNGLSANANSAWPYSDGAAAFPSPTYIKREYDGTGPSPEADGEKLSPSTEPGEPLRKKQKRNKPTLSCFECVERKTKVFHSVSGLLTLYEANASLA